MNDIKSVPGVGPQTLQHLNEAGIFTTKDMLLKYPKKYDSFKEGSLLLAVDKTTVTTTGIVATNPVVIQHRGSLKSLQFKLLVDHELYTVIALPKRVFKRIFKRKYDGSSAGSF